MMTDFDDQWDYSDYEEDISPQMETLLLATRCFGRATAFPHTLMQHFGTDKAEYDDTIAKLTERQMISAASAVAFDVTRQGYDWLAYRKVPPDVWLHGLRALLAAVETSIAADDRESLELLQIHSAGLANTFYSRDKKIWLQLMSFRVICLRYLGEHGQVEDVLHHMQPVMDELGEDDA
jgi:hypothetical protein